jgi:MFS family permease
LTLILKEKIMSDNQSNLRSLITVSVILGIGALAMGILRPILPLYLAEVGLNPSTLGLVVSVSMIGMVIGESLSGLVADRFGLRLPLVIGTVVCGAVMVSFVFSRAVPYLFVIGFLWGLTRVMVVGPSRGYLADAAPATKKATYLAISSAILSLSRGVGALPGGFIADKLGFDWVFYVAGGLAIAGGIAVIKSPNRPPVVAQEKITADLPGWKSILPMYSAQCLVAVFIFLNVSIMLTYLPLLGTEIIGMSATSVGAIFTVNGLATMGFSLPMGILADRIGKRTAMVLGLLACAGAMVGFACARDFGWLMALGIVHAFGMATFMPSALGLLSVYIPPGRQATAMGLYGGVCENSGLVVGSAIGGFVWEGMGVPATFHAGAIACGLGIILCLLLGKIKTGGGKVKLEECC